LGLLLLAALIFWDLVDDRFQTLSTRPSDVVLIAAVAIVMTLLWQVRSKHPDGRDLLTWNFALWTFASAFALTALLLITNASFDRSPPVHFATILGRRMCGRTSCQLRLVGAPTLPLQSPSVTIRDNFPTLDEPQVGDTVFLSVKAGFLKRPWVSSRSFHRVDRAQIPCFLLSRAAAHADTVAIAHLLAQGASIDASDSVLYCDSPLMSAAATADLATVDFLLRHGADPNRANSVGETPLMRAVTAQSLPVVRLLLSHHANAEAQSSGAHSVMGMALQTGDSSIIREIADAIPPKPHLSSPSH
jgi:ankyrin repeat protein